MNKRRPKELTVQTWDLRGWIALAVGVSVLFHFLLISLLKGYTFTWVGKVDDAYPPELPFKVDSLVIDKALLAPDFDQSTAQPEFNEDVTTEADILEIAEAVADREMELTPTVDLPSNLMLSATPAVAGGPDLSPGLAPDIEIPSPLAGDLAKELAAVSSAALEQMPAMSAEQAVIELGNEKEVAGLDEALMKELESASASGDAAETVDGYANLDDLLNYKGPILDASKPILMPTDLLFGYDQTELQESARLSLMKLGILIQRNATSTVVIEGHTDTTGPDTYNQELSMRRALAVKAWLRESLKIEGDQIQAIGYGESRPIVNPQGTIEEQALNRRVEIKFKAREKADPEVRRAEIAE
ncbi:MAG: OmpA family protein [Verrucomicrobia bacterium]|nr:OmpA family protein [Verrucomicrobiota bacterium]